MAEEEYEATDDVAEEGGERVIPQVIEDEMKRSYLDYAMSVIVGRALPDVRDGLKPVHRRILYAMNDMGMKFGTPYKKSARVVGECFVKDTLVLTEKGLLPIQDVPHGMKVYTQNGLQPVTELFVMPEKELLKVTLQNGTENIVTASQKFKVLTENWEYEWREAQDLKQGDSIVVKCTYPHIKEKVQIDGRRLTKGIAYLLGQLISDGWISKEHHHDSRICFGTMNEAIIQRIKFVLEEEFSYTPTIERREMPYETVDGQVLISTILQIRVNRKEINRFFVQNFDLENAKAKTKQIPKQVLRSPEDVVFSFISGLIDGDGSIHKERNIIHYGTISKSLSNQLAILLQHFNIHSTQYVTPPSQGGHIGKKKIAGTQEFHALEMSGDCAQRLAGRLDLAHEEKRERAKDLLKKRLGKSDYELLPGASKKLFEELSKHHVGSGWYIDTDGKKFRAGIKHPSGAKVRYSSDLHEKPLRLSQIIEWGIEKKLQRIGSELYDFLQNVMKDEVRFLRVKSIESAGRDITYDIQVKEQHEFIANGMLAHNCLGKYHPHGDSAVYETMVRMAQNFSLRYMLLDGQGNWGSQDGDSAAAMRYTECRLAKISNELMSDIDKETVDFVENFDGSLTEPSVLPAKLPNLLVNGSTGIAVGMATNIPPHNLREVSRAIIALINNPDIEIAELMEHVPGPDFPTGGIIAGKAGIAQAYGSGRGKLRVKSVMRVEEKGKRRSIVVTEIPYMVNKAQLIEQIADCVHDKTIEGVSDLRDESDRKGMRIVIDLKKDANPEIVENQVNTHSRMQVTFGINMVALVNGSPKTLNLKECLEEYLLHRRSVVRKRTEYDLRKAKERAHILEGLTIALDHIDEIVALIKGAADVNAAREGLIDGYGLTEIQANAILDMKLQKLAALEQEKIRTELEELKRKIEELQKILDDEEKILRIIKDELEELSQKYGDDRRTQILDVDDEELDLEDLIEAEDQVVMITHAGYAKRMSLQLYKEQRRGGKGVRGATTKEDDFIEHLFIANTHAYLLIFTDKGKVYWKKVYYLPEASRQSKGKAIINLVRLEKGERVNAVIPIKEFSKEEYLLFATRNGTVKKTRLSDYSRPRQGGIKAINLVEEDDLVTVLKTNGNDQVLLASAKGQAVKFNEGDCRPMGRVSTGVRGIRLRPKDHVVGAIKAPDEKSVLTITANGYGKRSPISDYRLINRGGSGVRNIICSGRNGDVVSVKSVDGTEGIMLSTKNGTVIRTDTSNIRIIGRNTQGVRIMSLRGDDQVVALAKIAKEEGEEIEETEE